MPATIQKILKPTKYRALDTSGNNNHGQIYSGRGLEFDGVSDSLSVPTGVTHNQDWRSGTIATYLYLESTPSTSDRIFSHFSSSHTRLYFALQNNGKLRHQLGDEDNFTDGNIALENKTWYRVVLTWNIDGTVNTYINGVLDKASTGLELNTSDTSMGSLSVNSVRIGGHNSTLNLFDGKMSNFQMWNSTWTQSDVTFDYLNPESLALNNGGTLLTESNLKLWYPMQDGHRGQQSYILDGASTGLGEELVTNADMNPDGAGWQFNNKWEGIANDTYVSTTNLSTDSDESVFYTTFQGKQVLFLKTSNASSNEIVDQSIAVLSGVTYKFHIRAWIVSGELKAYQSNANFQDNVFQRSSTTGQWEDIIGYLTCDSSGNTGFNVGVNDGGNVECYIDFASAKPVNDKHHATTVFLGDDLFDSNKGTFTNGSNELRTGSEITSGTLSDNTWYEISAQDGVDFTAIGAPNNNVGTIFCSTTEGGVSLPTMDENDKVYEIDLSWTTAVTGKMHLDSNTLKIIGAAGTTSPASLILNDAADLKEDLVVGRTYKVTYQAKVESGDSCTFKVVSGGVTTSAQTGNVTSTSFVDGSIEFLCKSADNSKLQASGTGENEVVFIDNITIKEVGVASGWTDADQQLDIPQTALQSYNQLAWFEGVNDRVICNDGFTPGNHTTVAFWVYMNGADGESRGLFDSISWNTSNFRIIASGNNELTVQIASDGAVTSYTSEMTNMTKGKWIHCVVHVPKAASSTGNLYVNGEKSTYSTTTTMESSSRDINIGYGGGLNQAYLNGVITEVSVWNTTLSSANVQELYNDGKGLNAKEHSKYIANNSLLTGYWKNNGLARWDDLAGSNHGVIGGSCSETLLLPAGVDASRDNQGFLMNRHKNTNSLNLKTSEGLTVVSDNNPDAVIIQDSESFDHSDGSNSKLSISAWFKANSYGSLPQDQVIVSKGTSDSGKREWKLLLDDSSTTQLLFMASSEGNGGSGNDLTYDLGDITDTNWHHIVVTYDGTAIAGNEVVAYLDGGSAIELTDADAEAKINAEDGNVCIGDILLTNTGGDGFEFDGQIDDVCYYNRKILSATEAKRNYNAGKRSHK